MMRICMLSIACAAGCVLLAGCATVPTPQAQSVAEVGSGMVEGCHLLGAVNGSSLMDGVLEARGVQSAKNEAMNEAAQWGANAIVWTHITQRYWGAELVTGNAYRCSKVAAADTRNH